MPTESGTQKAGNVNTHGVDCICPSCTYKYSEERYLAACKEADKLNVEAVKKFTNGLKFIPFRGKP